MEITNVFLRRKLEKSFDERINFLKNFMNPLVSKPLTLRNWQINQNLSKSSTFTFYFLELPIRKNNTYKLEKSSKKKWNPARLTKPSNITTPWKYPENPFKRSGKS